MVGVLIAMRLRVLGNSLRGRTAISFGLGVVAGIGAALGGLLLIAFHPGGITVGTDIASAIYAVWLLGWLFGPIMTGGGDETLRPENFALLPIRPAALARGLLVSALFGVTAAVTLLLLLGQVVLARPVGVGAVAVALVATVLELALMVLLSRVVAGALGAVLGSRRGKDLGVLLAALVGLLYLPANYAFQQLGPIIVGQTSPAFTGVLRGVPSGWGPSAVAAAADGRWLEVLAWLAALAALDAALLYAWSRLLVRRLTTVASSGPARKAAAGRSRVPRRSLLPDGPLGAVIGKELAMWFRDAQRRVLLLTSVLIGVLIPGFQALQGVGSGGVAFAALWIAVFGAMQVGNLYGIDGTAIWQTLVTPGAARADVRGRQWAWLLIVGPMVVLAATVLPGALGRVGLYPWLLALAPALLGAGAGSMMLASVWAPFPMPAARGRNPFASGGSGGFASVMTRLGIMALQLAVGLPALVLLVLGGTLGWPVASWIAVPVGVASGVGAAWWWGRVAYRRVADRGPELLAAVRAPA